MRRSPARHQERATVAAVRRALASGADQARAPEDEQSTQGVGGNDSVSGEWYSFHLTDLTPIGDGWRPS